MCLSYIDDELDMRKLTALDAALAHCESKTHLNEHFQGSAGADFLMRRLIIVGDET